MLLQFYIALYISKHFCIYCHLSLACFCATSFGTCSSLCMTLHILCRGLPLSHSHYLFKPSIFRIAMQFQQSLSFQLPFIYTYCIWLQSAAILNFYFSFVEHTGCYLNVIGKCIKSLLACQFHFIFYFYSIKSCNFDYSDLLQLGKLENCLLPNLRFH